MVIEIVDNGRNLIKITEFVERAFMIDFEKHPDMFTRQTGIEPMFVYDVSVSGQISSAGLGELIKLLTDEYDYVEIESNLQDVYNITCSRR